MIDFLEVKDMGVLPVFKGETETVKDFLFRKTYKYSEIEIFYMSLDGFKGLDLENGACGDYNYLFVDKYYSFLKGKELVDDSHVWKVSVVRGGVIFYPVAFLINMLVLGIGKEELLRDANLCAIYDMDAEETTLVHKTLALGLCLLYYGLKSEHEKSILDVVGLKKIKDFSFVYDGKLYNCVSNLGYKVFYFSVDKVPDGSSILEMRMVLEIQDNLKRFGSLKQTLNFKGVGSVCDRCSHGLKLVVDAPLIEFVEDLIVEEDYDEKFVDSFFLEKKEFKDGTKNAISILHFIDYYRECWKDVSCVYVVGVASNPHLLAFVDFFPDKVFYFYDPDGYGKSYNTTRRNLVLVTDFMKGDQDFEPNSVIVGDIRTDLDDDSVISDFKLQLKWSRHPNVLFGTYKFRFPYHKDMVFDAFKYDCLFIQSNKEYYSQESRLYISKSSVRSFEYTRKKYDGLNFFYNRYLRFRGYSCNDCKLREKVLKRFITLPYVWAIAFGYPVLYDFKDFLTDHDVDCDRLCKNPYMSSCQGCISVCSVSDAFGMVVT